MTAATCGRYFAYLVSFLISGIIWVNHHTVFSKVRWVDRPVLFANLALLLVVSALPFPTRLLAEYLTAGSDAQPLGLAHRGAAHRSSAYRGRNPCLAVPSGVRQHVVLV